MTAVGGPINRLSFDGREFGVASDADVNRDLGGDNNEVQMNGNKTGRIIKVIMPWKLEGLSLSIDDFTGDQEFLKSIANKKDFSVINITFASGSVYQGSGTITGEIKASSANTTAPIEVSGAGDLTQQ